MGYMRGVGWESRRGADSLTRQLPTIPKGDKLEKDGGSGGSCGSAEYSWKGSEKTQLFFLNSFSHFAIISASGIVFKKPLANKKLKLS